MFIEHLLCAERGQGSGEEARKEKTLRIRSKQVNFLPLPEGQWLLSVLVPGRPQHPHLEGAPRKLLAGQCHLAVSPPVWAQPICGLTPEPAKFDAPRIQGRGPRRRQTSAGMSWEQEEHHCFPTQALLLPGLGSPPDTGRPLGLDRDPRPGVAAGNKWPLSAPGRTL